jgi:hypothetical protein
VQFVVRKSRSGVPKVRIFARVRGEIGSNDPRAILEIFLLNIAMSPVENLGDRLYAL